MDLLSDLHDQRWGILFVIGGTLVFFFIRLVVKHYKQLGKDWNDGGEL